MKKKILVFIKVLKKVFDVESWRGEIKFTQGPGNADIQVVHRYNQFVLQIHKGFFDADLTYQADTLIHEFCHLFNLPVANLVGELREGNTVTPIHLDDVLENANMRAETTILNAIKSDLLRDAYLEYIKPKKKVRSVKRGSKLTEKKLKKKR